MIICPSFHTTPQKVQPLPGLFGFRTMGIAALSEKWTSTKAFKDNGRRSAASDLDLIQLSPLLLCCWLLSCIMHCWVMLTPRRF